MNRSFRLLLPLVALFALTACEPAHENIVHMPEGTGDTAGAGTTATAPAQGTTPTGTAAAGAPAAENTVDVTLVNYRIEMPGTLPAGPTSFRITNGDQVEHNFEVEGQGIEKVLPQNLSGGETATLQVDLQPGTYTVYCPVGDHRSRGMEMKLTVTEGSQSAGQA